MADERLVLQPDEVEFREDLSYDERPVRVLVRQSDTESSHSIGEDTMASTWSRGGHMGDRGQHA